MASGRLDLFIAKLPVHTIVLTLGCTAPAELAAIPRHKTITLQRGTIKQAVQVQFLEGRECFADFMEMNYSLARRFQLQALRRYLLTYHPSTQTLSIQPSPVTEGNAMLYSHNQGYLSIGYELATKLGIPERRGFLLKVRYGKWVAGLRLHVPINLSDDRLRLPAFWTNRWKLPLHQPFRVQFDQRTATLTLIPLQLATSRH